MNVWDLIEAGEFSEACAEADREIAALGYTRSFEKRNKVIALLKLGNILEAEELCAKIRETSQFENEFDSVFMGVAQWLQNKREAAIASWQRAMRAHFVDAAGGVESRLLLLYAARAEGLGELEKMALTSLKPFSPRAAWPGPLASFAVGRFDEGDVRARISTIEALHRKYS